MARRRTRGRDGVVLLEELLVRVCELHQPLALLQHPKPWVWAHLLPLGLDFSLRSGARLHEYARLRLFFRGGSGRRSNIYKMLAIGDRWDERGGGGPHKPRARAAGICSRKNKMEQGAGAAQGRGIGYGMRARRARGVRYASAALLRSCVAGVGILAADLPSFRMRATVSNCQFSSMCHSSG
jgi:hypothetical protein